MSFNISFKPLTIFYFRQNSQFRHNFRQFSCGAIFKEWGKGICLGFIFQKAFFSRKNLATDYIEIITPALVLEIA